MSCSSSCTDTILKSASTETEWVKQIESILHLDLHRQLTPSIFQVPEDANTNDSKPAGSHYRPQMVGLGPLFHGPFQHGAITSLKRRFAEQSLRRLEFPDDDGGRSFAEQVVTPLLPIIRASYDAHLDIPDTNLAYILAVDFLFVFELVLQAADQYPAQLINDVVMLGNQIPIFLITDHIESTTAAAAAYRRQQLLFFDRQVGRFCQQISPLKLTTALQGRRRPRHLLDYLYLHITAGGNGHHHDVDAAAGVEALDSTTDPSELYEIPNSSVLQILETIPAGLLLRHLGTQNPVLEVARSLKNASKTSAVRWIGSAVTFMEKLGLINYVDQINGQEPLIPTASELTQGGGGIKILCISPTTVDGGDGLGATTTTISFDEGERILRLPVFTWTPSCEVLMRNLVAYESMAGAGEVRPAIMTRYVELMHDLTAAGSAREVKLLRETGVIAGDPEHDADVGKLFGKKITTMTLSSSTATTATTGLDFQIQAVNRCYSNNVNTKWKVLCRRSKVLLGRLVGLLLMMLSVGLVLVPAISLLISIFTFNLWDCITPWMALLPPLPLHL